MMVSGINEKDNQIVQLLLEYTRLSYSDIGEQVGLRRTTVKNRIATLEKSGIIKGYQAILCPSSHRR